ncbi:MAG: DUF1858 domain-containing protein [Armatimonadota bacterium]|nr:DUF1858 domain-containing protein [Armatimonadota bacterium]
MSEKKMITKDMTIAEVLEICPRAVEILNALGMGCFACMAAETETIEQGAQMHNMDVQEIIDKLNACQCE